MASPDSAAAIGGSCVRIATRFDGNDTAGLKRTARSLLDQSFDGWEWVVAVPRKDDGSVREALAQAIGDDPRIRVVDDDLAGTTVETGGRAVVRLGVGDVVGPVALERALWRLACHPELEEVELDHSSGLTARRTGSRIRRGRIRGRRSRAAELAFDPLPFSNTVPKTGRRLLMIVPWLQLGGADTFTLNVASELARRGWELTVVTTETGGHSWLPELERVTPDVFALSQFLRHSDYPRFLRYAIESRQPDALLIMHSAFAYNILPYLRVVAAGRPIVDFTHIDEQSWYDGGYARFSLENSDLLDLQITASQYLKDWLVSRGADAERVEVCHINVDVQPPERVPTRAELGLPEEVPLLLYPCRIIEQKQPQVFAKTVLELSRRGEPFLALVVGQGPLLPWLEAFVGRNGLGDVVRFLGERSQEWVRGFMEAVDVVFLPSRHEGIAASLYEALAAGTPVVGADVGGQSELVTPDCGVLLPRGSGDDEAQRYADALASLLADDDARQRMGAAGQARVRATFTLEHMGGRMEALLERAAAVARSNPRPTPTVRRAQTAAREAVEIAPWTSLAPGLSPRVPLWRVRVFALVVVTRLGRPVYRLSVRMGLGGTEPIRRWLTRVFNPAPRSSAGRDHRDSAK